MPKKNDSEITIAITVLNVSFPVIEFNQSFIGLHSPF